MSNILPKILPIASGGETLLFPEALLQRGRIDGSSFRWSNDMKEEDLVFDRNCHAIYSKECKQAILKCIASHYPEDEIDGIFTQVQQQYVSWLQNYRTDLGGKANFHNGVGGTIQRCRKKVQ